MKFKKIKWVSKISKYLDPDIHAQEKLYIFVDYEKLILILTWKCKELKMDKENVYTVQIWNTQMTKKDGQHQMLIRK